MIEEIKKLLAQSAERVGVTNPVAHLEHPEDMSHGDFSSNIAMVYAKSLKLAPKVLAEKIIEEFKKDLPKDVVSVEIAGPGFINFKISRNYFNNQAGDILEQGEHYGNQKIGKGKTVIVEYSSPNIAKPFTVGHLRSTIIGDAIANILHTLGYKVIRDNHLGDWGTQFGKLMVAILTWGKKEDIEKSGDPMRLLVDLYVKFHDEAEKDPNLEEEARGWFRKLEQGDSEAKSLWTLCIEASLVAFDKIYKELGVSDFDTMRGESMAIPLVPDVLAELKSKNLMKESEGAQVIFFEGEKYPPLIIQKTDGTSIYATRDLATDAWRKKEYGKDLTIINEVGADQILYFRQLFEIEKMLGWFAPGERVHVAHGLYRFKEGKMSTRKGDVIWLADIIDEAKKRAAAINPDSAHEVALAAIKFNDLKRDSAQDIVFDWEEIMNTGGDSGPYLQYACVRAKSALAKADALEIKLVLDAHHSTPAPETENLEKFLIRFPEIIERAGAEYKPNILATYLIDLASKFNNFYAHNVIADKENPRASHNAALTKAFTLVMENGLKLLGIKVPERM